MSGTLLQLEEALAPVLEFLHSFVFPIFKTWWWILPPFLLIKPALFFWLWWRRELNWKSKEYVLLEIKIPAEILKPIKAMEDVFSSLTIVDISPGNFREKWIEGDSTIYPPLSFEIVSDGGKTHFYIRTEKPFRHLVESALYSQYPNIEISEVEDYTKHVPQDIPNEKWDLEGRELILKKENCYPIKTYEKFETGMEAKEEKRVDPMAGLLEGLSMLKEGEQLWIQILATLNVDGKWVKEGAAIRDKLVKRPGPPPPPKPIIQGAIELLIAGPPKKKEGKEEKLFFPEMTLTPGEREIVKEIERKISKPGFDVVIRYIYLAKRDVFFKPHLHFPTSFLLNFNTQHLNRFGTFAPTTTKVKSTFFWRADKRRAFLRKRKMFRNYIMRFTPLFPQKGGTSVLNTEELASIFHFPGRMVAPAPLVPRIEAKKGEAPPGLPVE